MAKPVLSQFEVAPAAGCELPPLQLDAVTGLSFRPEANSPFIDEALSDRDKWGAIAAAPTLLTETRDPADPDLVRMDAFLGCGASTVTRSQGETPDPDLVRAGITHLLAAAIGTTVTKMPLEGRDPDLVRQ